MGCILLTAVGMAGLVCYTDEAAHQYSVSLYHFTTHFVQYYWVLGHPLWLGW